jgi:hypothetical protein
LLRRRGGARAFSHREIEHMRQTVAAIHRHLAQPPGAGAGAAAARVWRGEAASPACHQSVIGSAGAQRPPRQKTASGLCIASASAAMTSACVSMASVERASRSKVLPAASEVWKLMSR